MVTRTNITHTNLKARSNSSRATVREFDDNHLIQQVKKADVFHSETPSDFERFQMVGLTSMPLKQSEDKQQSANKTDSSKSSEGEGDWNHDQPKGKAAEAIMLYMNGDRNHPIALVDDRRVRPYALKEGETALYSASGTGQMAFFNDKGSYLIAVNNKGEGEQSEEGGEGGEEPDRFASLRHVEKQKQSREIKEGQEPEDPHHEGETVNLEVRVTKGKIEFRSGDDVIGYYDKDAETWCFKGKILLGTDDEEDLKKAHRVTNIDSDGDEATLGSEMVYIAS